MRSIVVGASRGLGLELVIALAQCGGQVTAVYNHPSERLQQLAALLPGITPLHADVRTEQSLMTLTAQLRNHTTGGRAKAASTTQAPSSKTTLTDEAAPYGRSAPFDQLIYNAAIHLEQDRKDLMDAVIDDITTTFDVNTVGAVRTVKHLRPLLRDGGQLVLISSEAGSIGDCWRGNEYGYCMSKAALNMFARLLEVREEKLGSNIDVRAIHPGWLRTDMGGPNADDSATDAAKELLDTLQRPRQTSLYTDRHGVPLPF